MGEGILAGKAALVTGASDGIGLASAAALAKDGADVVIMSRREDALAKAKNEIFERTGKQVTAIAGDAVDEATVKSALALTHDRGGHLDILVSVVGAPTFKPLLMRELADVRQELDINFCTAFLLTRHGVPLLKPGGTIVCVSSAGATQAYWGLSIYGSAKAALERFVKAAAYELGGAGIRINAVRPGMTLSKEKAAQPEFAGMAALCASETPLGRIGEPDDLARVVRFLAGPESGWVTGQTFSVDGGQDQGKGPDLMDAIYGKETMDQIRGGKSVQVAN